jgi:hypothetical protein
VRGSVPTAADDLRYAALRYATPGASLLRNRTPLPRRVVELSFDRGIRSCTGDVEDVSVHGGARELRDVGGPP